MTEDEHDDIRVRAMKASRMLFDNLKEMRQVDISDLCLAFILAQREAIAAEREACAKIADEMLQAGRTHRNVLRDEEAFAINVAAAIRARGQQT